MAGAIKVDPQKLLSAEKVIKGKAGDYQGYYNDLYKKTDAMSAAWQGKDNIAYINQIAGFKDDFEKMFNLMESYAQFLQVSAQAYTDTQDHVTGQASKLVN